MLLAKSIVKATYLNLLLGVLTRLHHLHLLAVHELLLLAIVLHHLLAVHVDHTRVHATVHLLLLHHLLLLLHLGCSVFVEHLLLTAIFGHVIHWLLSIGTRCRLWRGSLLDLLFFLLGWGLFLLLCGLLSWLLSRLFLLFLSFSFWLLFRLVAHILNIR